MGSVAIPGFGGMGWVWEAVCSDSWVWRRFERWVWEALCSDSWDWRRSGEANRRRSCKSIQSRGRSSIQRIRKDDSPQEVSYAEAFERLGGEAELERCADVIALVRAEVANDESLEDELREFFPGDASMRRGYSTKLVYQHYVAGLDELYELAEKVQPVFEEATVDLARATGGTPQLPGLKGRERTKVKAEFKYAVDGGVAWYRVTDVVRATIVYETISDM